MIVAHGSASGLPEFAEIIQMCIINEELFLIVKVLCGWYSAHYRAFELNLLPSREIKLVALSDLTDTYPLADYIGGSSRMVTLKRHIVLKGELTSKNWCIIYMMNYNLYGLCLHSLALCLQCLFLLHILFVFDIPYFLSFLLILIMIHYTLCHTYMWVTFYPSL